VALSVAVLHTRSSSSSSALSPLAAVTAVGAAAVGHNNRHAEAVADRIMVQRTVHLPVLLPVRLPVLVAVCWGERWALAIRIMVAAIAAVRVELPKQVLLLLVVVAQGSLLVQTRVHELCC
jgi:hypothetical protein